MKDDDKRDSYTKILAGVTSLLLAIVGYFLVSRDAEVMEGMRKLWIQVAQIEVRTDRLEQSLQFNTESDKDREQRIRALENRRTR